MILGSHVWLAGDALAALQQERQQAFDTRFQQTFGRMDGGGLPAGVSRFPQSHAEPYARKSSPFHKHFESSSMRTICTMT